MKEVSEHETHQNSPGVLWWLINSELKYITAPLHLWKGTIRHICPCLFTCKHVLLFIQIKWGKEKHLVFWGPHSRYSINITVFEKNIHKRIRMQYPGVKKKAYTPIFQKHHKIFSIQYYFSQIFSLLKPNKLQNHAYYRREPIL